MNVTTMYATTQNVISGTDWGLTGGDIWTQGMAIVGSLAGFVLLGITVRFAPKIFSVIRAAVFGGGK